MSGPSRNTVWAGALMDELARAGVREICLAPGSRSTPLVMAAARDGRLRILTHLDERSAAFLALGIGKAARRPAAVITTSGTAAANLYPAVIEASESEVPLLLLTADRPHRLRDADANQAIDQVRLYGSHVRAFFDVAPPRVGERDLRHLRGVAARAVAAATGVPAGPVHLNLPFEKPLEPIPVEGDVPPRFEEEHPLAARGRSGARPFVAVRQARPAPDPESIEELRRRITGARRPLLVAGPHPEAGRVGPAAVAAARALEVPLLADPLSGARHGAGAGKEGGSRALAAYDLLLRSPGVREALRPDLVLRVGSSPTSAALLSLLRESPEADQVVVDAGGRWKDHLAVAAEYHRADPAALLDSLAAAPTPASAGPIASGPATGSETIADSGPDTGSVRAAWLSLWCRLDRRAREAAGEAMAGEFFEGSVLAGVVRRLPADAALLVSNSMPIRDADAFGFSRPEPLEAFGNRGASGIDGIVSTAFGIAVVHEGPVVCVLGDLALFHDMNGLLASRLNGLEVLFVVINNDGGGIFHMLPIREHEPAFTPYFATPHGLDFSHAAALHGVPHVRVGGAEALDRALGDALTEGGTRIVEVSSDRERNRLRHREVEAAVRQAVEAELHAAG